MSDVSLAWFANLIRLKIEVFTFKTFSQLLKSNLISHIVSSRSEIFNRIFWNYNEKYTFYQKLCQRKFLDLIKTDISGVQINLVRFLLSKMHLFRNKMKEQNNQSIVNRWLRLFPFLRQFSNSISKKFLVSWGNPSFKNGQN